MSSSRRDTRLLNAYRGCQTRLLDRNRDLLPVIPAKEDELDCDLEVLADNLGPDVQGSEMRQRNTDRTGVDAVLDAAFELGAFDLVLLDWAGDIDKGLDGDGLAVQVHGADDLRRYKSVLCSGVG